MNKAKKGKNDEFYTILSDVEKEMKHYKKHFKDKTIFCNCDDPRISNFFHYFSYNFNSLKLKKLITTCYKNQQMDLFSKNDSDRAIYLEINKIKGKVPERKEIKKHNLKGDGDFRSKECIEILKKSDIIVTNPPFSLFREYVGQLEKYKKKFLIIGTWNVISYKEIFPLIKDNKIWIGVNSNRNFSGFIVPKHYKLFGTETSMDEKGNRIVKSNQNCWFTNLDVTKRHEELILTKKYSKAEFPIYDNYNAINVDTTKNIPMDYEGAMGVPITFLDKFNPNQFEIIGNDVDLLKRQKDKRGRFYVKDVRKYARMVIKLKKNKNSQKKRKK